MYSYIPTCVKTFLKQKKCHTDGFFLLNECYGWSSIKSQSLFIRKWDSTSIFWMYVSNFLCVQSIGAPFRNESFKLDEKWLREMLQMLYFWSTNIQASFSLFLPNYVLISEDILLYLKPLISEECGAGEIIMLENWIRPVPNHKSAVDW